MTVIVAISLLHFLWQGAVIGGIAWIAMRIVRSTSARYAIGVAALLAMTMAPLATGAWVRNTDVQGPGSRVLGPESGTNRAESGTRDPGRWTLDSSGRWTLDRLRQSVQVSPSLAKWLLTSWLLGVGLLSIRLSSGWWTARRLTRVDVRPTHPEILSRSERVKAALGITAAVRVLESSIVQVPTVVGWITPAVLLPVSAMSGLAIAQIEALVAHELAHIKRHDYLVNLFQCAIETLLFYHPAVWFISRRVRHERELCCDDIAVEVCGDRMTYASALADLESLRALPEPALAATGGSLLVRVLRILAPDDVQTVKGRGPWVAGVAILSAALVMFAAENVQGKHVAQVARVAQDAQVARDAQGAQVVQGVPGGVTGGVMPGIAGGIESGVPSGVPGGVEDGVTSGVSGGVPSGVKGGIVAVPVPQQPVRVGGNIAPPQRIKFVGPVYPQAAMEAKVSGIVIAEIVVGEDGQVTDARILRSIALLDEAALDAVRQWRYAPTLVNGRPVPLIVTVTINVGMQDAPAANAPVIPRGATDVPVLASQDEPVLWNGREVMKIGGTVKAPERVRYVAPVYPQEAQAARVSGIVIIQAVIDETGHVVTTKVLRSIALLDQAAIDAVSQWEYTPTLLDGVAVPVVMTVTVNFTVQ